MSNAHLGGYSATQQEQAPFIEFFSTTEEDRAETIKQGRLVFRDVDMVRLRQRGSKDSCEKNAEDFLKEYEMYSDTGRCPPEWGRVYREAFNRWKAGESGPVAGTDIRNWPGITRAQVENLRTMGILSVEDVSKMNEPTMNRVGMGAVALKNRAVAYLADQLKTGSSIQVAALTSDNEAQKVQIADLQRQLQELSARIGVQQQSDEAEEVPRKRNRA